MKPRNRRLLNIIGLGTFLIVLGIAIYDSPPNLYEISYGWLGLAAFASTIAVATQAAQSLLFMNAEGVKCSWQWATWFASEKAWINTMLPAKAGTAAAVALLQAKFSVAWSRYLRFLAQCTVIAIAATLAGAALLLMNSMSGALAGTAIFLGASVGSRFFYRASIGQTSILAALAVINLLALTGGLVACLVGLGYETSLLGIAPAAIALNLLSVASITPGNFGIREIVLAALSPLIPISFGSVIQASTCYVFIRAMTSFVVATLLRNKALHHTV